MFTKRKLLVYVGLALAGFYLYTRPTQAGDAVGGLFDLVATGADRIAIFLSALTG